MLARESPQAILLCVPRAKEVVSVGWDRATDTFTIGQWLKGRVRFGDISPDGAHWIYYGYDPRTIRTGGDWRNEGWTALARTPYLKALALFRSEGPGGGGHFEDARTFSVWDQKEEQRLDCFPKDIKRSQFPGVLAYEKQRMRDGWCQPEPSRFQKALPHGWLLKELPSDWPYPIGRPAEAHPYRLTNPTTGPSFDFPTWEWADWDPIGNRLVWTDQGVLHAATLSPAGLDTPKTLFDARPLKFEAICAPY